MSLRDAFKRRVYAYGEFRDALSGVLRDRSLRRAGRLDPAFRERLMLAVTEVNGCRYCSFLHSRLALSSGMDDAEVRALLGGELEGSPEEQLPALMFAQHWAETRGRPSREAIDGLLQTYDRDTAGDIIAAIQSIMIGNLYGNTVDAFGARLRGRTVPERSLAELVAVLVGGVWIVPAVGLGMAWRWLTGRGSEPAHPIDVALRRAAEDRPKDPEPLRAA